MNTTTYTQSDPTICGWIDWDAGRICGRPATHTEQSAGWRGSVIVNPLCDSHTLAV